MDVLYNSGKLEKDVEIKRNRDRKYKEISPALKAGVDILKAATNLSEVSHMPPTHRHKLGGNHKNRYAIDISKKDRIVFEPVGQCDTADISTITVVKIIFIGDYH